MKDIEAFAELGEHFDYLVKTYSSGMFVCLAFSTFIFWNRLVDETLSVGDFFQSLARSQVRVEAPNLGVILHDRLGQGIFSTHVHGQGVEHSAL